MKALDQIMPVPSPAAAPKRGNLRAPWRKGESGNPRGYRAQYGEVVSLAREYSEPAIRRLGQLLQSDDERVAVVAAQALLDRGWGKARPFPDEEPVPEGWDIDRLSDEDVETLNRLIRIIAGTDPH